MGLRLSSLTCPTVLCDGVWRRRVRREVADTEHGPQQLGFRQHGFAS